MVARLSYLLAHGVRSRCLRSLPHEPAGDFPIKPMLWRSLRSAPSYLTHVDFRRMKTGTAAYLWLETPGAAVELGINLPGAAYGEGYFGGFIFMLEEAADYVELPEGSFTGATLLDVAHAITSHFLSDRKPPSTLGSGVR